MRNYLHNLKTWALGWGRYRLAKFVDRFLGKFDRQHGEHAGPPLWNTRDCDSRLQLVLLVVWAAVLTGALL